MKKASSYLFTSLLAALLFTACNNDRNAIEKAAFGYLDALGNYRVADARPFATPQTCDVTLNFLDTLAAHTNPQVYANNIPAVITINDVSMTSDTTATVAFHKSTPSTQQDGTIDVVKVDGKWLVDQIIDIPEPLKSLTAPDHAPRPRSFSDEEIKQMRDNKAAAQ